MKMKQSVDKYFLIYKLHVIVLQYHHHQQQHYHHIVIYRNKNMTLIISAKLDIEIFGYITVSIATTVVDVVKFSVRRNVFM